MSLRPVRFLFFVISAFWLSVVAPAQAAAETFLVVINAGNRISGSDAELREVVRQLYLKEESRWPDDLPSLPIARPAKNPATSAFTEAVLGVSPEDLETHWAEAGAKPPGAIGPVRDLLRQISRNKGAFSVVAAAEAEKLPAKVRVLFEFTTTAPGGKGDAAVAALPPSTEPAPSQAGSFDGKWVLKIEERNWIPEVITIRTRMVSREFSTSIEGHNWRGHITGLIDDMGRLHVDGTLHATNQPGRPLSFSFATEPSNGFYRTEFAKTAPPFIRAKFNITLTPESPIAALAAQELEATEEPETVALSPPSEPAPSQAAAPEDIEPILSREDVLAYVSANKKLIQSRLAYYTTEHRLLKRVKDRSPDEAEIRQFQIVDISGDSVLAEITYKFGDVNRGNRVVEGTFPFHLQWIDENLQFVGHGEAAVAALPPPTESTPGQAGSFDGQWELVFKQIEGASAGGTQSEGTVVETSVVNNRFSVRFTSSAWQGQVSGNIDESGTLVGNGWAVSQKRVTPQKFDFEADYSAGAFQADIVFVPTWGVRVICRVTLTRAG